MHFGGPNINYNIVLYQRNKNKRKIKLLFCTKDIKIRENYYYYYYYLKGDNEVEYL